MSDPVRTDTDPAELGYAGSLAEIDRILTSLEDDDVDVDLLASRVERAATLIRFCRERVVSARSEVEQVVADLADAPDEPDEDER